MVRRYSAYNDLGKFKMVLNLPGASSASYSRSLQFQLPSGAAVLKLGASQEGILRRDRVTWTGRIRDTVVFSILADEWPAVRDRLDARLAAAA